MSTYTPEAKAKHIESHQRHMTAGFCGAVHDTKAWCNDKMGHSGQHHAPHVGTQGLTGKATYWIVDAGCPCPPNH